MFNMDFEYEGPKSFALNMLGKAFTRVWSYGKFPLQGYEPKVPYVEFYRDICGYVKKCIESGYLQMTKTISNSKVFKDQKRNFSKMYDVLEVFDEVTHEANNIGIRSQESNCKEF